MRTVKRFPFWSTLRKAHASISQNAGTAARVMLPLLLLYCAISAALSAWHFSFDRSAWMSGADTAFGIADEAAGVVLITYAAVKWHRFLLLAETPERSPLSAPPVLARYLLLALVVWSVATLPFYAVAYGLPHVLETSIDSILGTSPGQPATDAQPVDVRPPDATKAPEQAETQQQDGSSPTEPEDALSGFGTLLLGVAVIAAVALAAWAVLGYLPMRMSLALPAIATGNAENAVSRAWNLSRGNFWRLYWGSVLSVVPAFVGALISAALVDDTTRAGFTLSATILAGLLFASTLIWVGSLSHAYRVLVSDNNSHDAEALF